MWHVAPESTSQQVLGSPIPTLPTKPSSVLLRWCVTGLSVLDIPVAPFGPPASDLHCKGFDYHSSLVSTLLLNF